MLLLVVALRQHSLQQIMAGTEFTACDAQAGTVKKFFSAAKLPYRPDFVSIACFRSTVPSSSVVRAYAGESGAIAVLNNELVLEDIAVAAHDDIQDIAVNGWRKERVAEYAKRFVYPRVGAGSKEAALLYAADNAVKYAEARLYRPLTKQDILRFAK